MKLDGILSRAKKHGIKAFAFQMNPKPKLFTSCEDTELGKVMGAAVAFMAIEFSKVTKGEINKEQMLDVIFKDIALHAKRQLSLMSEIQTPEDVMNKFAADMVAKHLSDLDNDESDEGGNQ